MLLLIITGILLCIMFFIRIFENCNKTKKNKLLKKKRKELKNKNKNN